MNIIFRNFKQSSSKIQLQRDVLLFEPCENSKFDPFFVIFSPYLCIHTTILFDSICLLLLLLICTTYYYYLSILDLWHVDVTDSYTHTHTFYLLYTYIYSALEPLGIYVILGFFKLSLSIALSFPTISIYTQFVYAPLFFLKAHIIRYRND